MMCRKKKLVVVYRQRIIPGFTIAHATVIMWLPTTYSMTYSTKTVVTPNNAKDHSSKKNCAGNCHVYIIVATNFQRCGSQKQASRSKQRFATRRPFLIASRIFALFITLNILIK